MQSTYHPINNNYPVYVKMHCTVQATNTHTQTHDYVTPTQQLCVEEHEQTSVIENNRSEYGPH